MVEVFQGAFHTRCNWTSGFDWLVGAHLGADDNTLAAGGLGLVIVLVIGGALVGLVGEAAAGTAAVELDAVAGTGDSVAFAGAAAGGRADAGWRRAVGGARGQGRDIRLVVGIDEGVGVGVVGDGLVGKTAGESLKRGLVVLGVDDLAGLVWALRAGSGDPLWREGAALGDGGSADAAGVAGRLGRGGGAGRLLGWDVEDVELAASGGLSGEFAGGIVRDVVAVDDVVVPVSLTLLESGTLEFEASDPAAALLGVLGERELSGVVVPRAEQMDGLAVGGSAESEVKLDSGHCECSISKNFCN